LAGLVGEDGQFAEGFETALVVGDVLGVEDDRRRRLGADKDGSPVVQVESVQGLDPDGSRPRDDAELQVGAP